MVSYKIIRNYLGYEIIKIFFCNIENRWITETVGTTISLGVAKEFLKELEEQLHV